MKYHLYTIVWGLSLLALCFGREQSLPTLILPFGIGFDKVAHFFSFFLLSFFMVVGFAKQNTIQILYYYHIQSTFVICTIWASLMALIQYIRLPLYLQIGDWLASILGTIIGLVWFWWIMKEENHIKTKKIAKS